MPRARVASPTPAPTARVPIKKVTTLTETIDAPESGTEELVQQAQPTGRKEEVREELQEFQFWEKLQRMSAKDWDRCIAYVSRHKGEYKEEGKPWDRPPRGSGYLEKFSQPFTIDDIKQRYGGGWYWCIVNYDGRGLFSGNFRILGEPKGDVTYTPPTSNTEERLLQFVEKQMDEVKANLKKPDEAVAKVMELMGNAHAATVEMLKKQIPAPTDPMAYLTSIMTVLKEMRGMDPAKPAENGDFLKSLELADRLGLLVKRNEDPFSAIDKVMDKLRTFGVIPNGASGSGGKEDWKVALASNLPQIMQSAEGMVGRIVTGIIQTRTLRPVQTAGQMDMSGFRPGATLVGSHAPQQPAQAPGAAATAAPAPQPATEADQLRQAQTTVETWLWVRVVELFNGGNHGDDVASFLQLAAPEAATYFGSQTPAELETMMSGHPILKSMANHPRLKKFLEEFHSYFTEEEPEAAPDATKM